MNLSWMRWLRLVAPPAWVWAVFVLIGGLLNGLLLVLTTFTPLGRIPLAEMPKELFNTMEGMAILAAVCYAWFRIVAFHPLFSGTYRQWLWLTPWRAGMRLPRGPIQFVPQDLLVLAIVVGWLGWPRLSVTCISVPLAFLTAHYLLFAVSLWVVGLRWPSYALVALVGLAIWLANWNLAWGLGVAVLGYGIVRPSIDWTLRLFPWTERTNALYRLWRSTSASRPSSATQSVGDLPEIQFVWPFHRLHATQYPAMTTRLDRVAGAILLGWWYFVLFSFTLHQVDAAVGQAIVYSAVLTVSVAGRLFWYCYPCAPPINLWGRLFTGRWIIPAYDVALVAPLVTLLFGWLAPIGCIATLGMKSIVALSCCLSANVLLITLSGPAWERWQLTCPCRFRQGLRKAQLVDEI